MTLKSPQSLSHSSCEARACPGHAPFHRVTRKLLQCCCAFLFNFTQLLYLAARITTRMVWQVMSIKSEVRLLEYPGDLVCPLLDMLYLDIFVLKTSDDSLTRGIDELGPSMGLFCKTPTCCHCSTWSVTQRSSSRHRIKEFTPSKASPGKDNLTEACQPPAADLRLGPKTARRSPAACQEAARRAEMNCALSGGFAGLGTAMR